MRIQTLAAIVAFSLTTYSQYSISTIDYQTSFYTGGDIGNPFGLGITLTHSEKKLKLFGRVSGFSQGRFQNKFYQDTARSTFCYDDKVVYLLPEGDSVLTRTYGSYAWAIGIQAGVRNDFKLLGIPLYSSAHVGIFAHKHSYTLVSSYTINSPDSVFNGDDFVYVDEYSRRTTFNVIEDEGWSILPQIGLETGLILSAGKRLQFIPKVILNISYERISGIQNTSGLFTTQEIRKNYALDLQASAGLQVLFLLNKK
jgi:hypothetical protein